MRVVEEHGLGELQVRQASVGRLVSLPRSGRTARSEKEAKSLLRKYYRG